MKRKFYRVCNIVTGQGLWYDQAGGFTGLIHGAFSFCKNSTMQMPFDDNVVGYLSATLTIADLFQWFTREDIAKLEPYDYFIHEYEADDYFYYEQGGHFVINQSRSQLIRAISLDEFTASIPSEEQIRASMNC